jgi:hypothetical protein
LIPTPPARRGTPAAREKGLGNSGRREYSHLNSPEPEATERDNALSRNDRLLHFLHRLRRMQFGRRSEKLDPTIGRIGGPSGKPQVFRTTATDF